MANPHVPPMGFAGQAQQTNASKVAHYGMKKSGGSKKKRSRSKTAGVRTKSPKGRKASKAKGAKKKSGPKHGTAAWMKKIRGMRGKKKK